MTQLRTLGVIVMSGLSLVAADSAWASVTVAKKAKYTGRVSVSGKAPNTSYQVWQSSAPAGTPDTDTGSTITTDGAGNGTVSISNVSSGTLLVGHNVTIGDNVRPSTQTPLTVVKARGWIFDPWFASVSTGMNGPATGTISQAVVAQGSTLLETWDANSVFSLSLNPAEASWVDMGAGITTMGDLQVQLTQFTPQTISFRVISDPTFTTLDDVRLTGVGMNVVAPVGASVGILFGYSGSTSTYQDDQFLDTFNGSGEYEYERLGVIPAPGTLAAAGVIFVIAAQRRRR